MTKNLYYQTMFARQSFIVSLLLELFLTIASVPRMLLEVFIRKNFGERYFSPLTGFFILIFLAGVPMGRGIFALFSGASLIDAIRDNVTWYLYLGAFVYATILRWREVWRSPSVFDFARFSLSTGDIHPRFYNLTLFGKSPNVRTIEIWLEPGFFFCIGLFLWGLGQDVGILLTICSILYSLSYVAAYKKGDDFVMDRIDKLICTDELAATFIEERDSRETRGFRFYGRRPADPEKRRRAVATFVEDEDDVAVAR